MTIPLWRRARTVTARAALPLLAALLTSAVAASAAAQSGALSGDLSRLFDTGAARRVAPQRRRHRPRSGFVQSRD